MALREYFQNKTDIEVIDVENLSRLKNVVYKINTGQKYFILKIFQNGETRDRRFRTESSIYKTYSNVCELLPQLFFEDFTCQDFGSPVICREYKGGSDLKHRVASELSRGNDNRVKLLIRNSIGAANRIHELKISDSYGTVLSDYPGSYLEFVLHEKNFGFGLPYEQLCKFLTEVEGGKLLETYLTGSNLITPQKFTLCHNDFRGHEILVGDDDTVNGVIDWEQAIIGDPLCDFGSHIFSLLNSVHNDIPSQEKIIHTFLDYMPQSVDSTSLPFYLAERAVLTSIVYYYEYNPEKFKWAMRFARNMLSNSMNSRTDLIQSLKT